MASLRHGELAIKIENDLKNVIFDASLQKLITKKDGGIELTFNFGIPFDLIRRLAILFNTEKIDIEPKAESDGGCCCHSCTETYLIIFFNDGQLCEERLKEFVVSEIKRTVEIYVKEGKTKSWAIPHYLEEYIIDIKNLFPEYEVKELKSPYKKTKPFFVLSWEEYEKRMKEKEIRDASGRA